MTATIAIRHNFETSHRLPFLGGKCFNLHGHSWQVKATLMSYESDGLDQNGISVEFSEAKKLMRAFIDQELDHGCMLGSADSLVPTLKGEGCKLFLFGEGGEYVDMPWPTVEAVARMLTDYLQSIYDEGLGKKKIWVDSVLVRETAVNEALWVQPLVMGSPDNA